MEITNIAAAEVAETVADNFESGVWDWHQGSYVRPHLSVDEEPYAFCAVGAVWEIVSTAVGPWLEVLEPALWKAIGTRGRAIYTSIPDWNDSPSRTKAEVIDAFKGAAKVLRNGEV
jgi:hypothetical protein